jgi:hypothetical protein
MSLTVQDRLPFGAVIFILLASVFIMPTSDEIPPEPSFADSPERERPAWAGAEVE